VLERFVRGCVGMSNYELPPDFEDIQPDLLPVVRSRFFLESVQLQAQLRGSDVPNVPCQVVGEHLAMSLVYDLPHAMRSIGHDDLDRWDVNFYQALETARQNLEQLSNVAFANINNHCFASATGDNYDASRLVLVELIRRLPVRGEPVAMVPNRDSLIITGSDDEAGLQIMAKLANESLQQPRPISTIALQLEGDQWQPWLPEAGTPLHETFRELRLKTLASEYSEQAELLMQLHEAHHGERPANFNLIQDTTTQRVSSYCVWTEGAPALLPEADQIAFVALDASGGRMLGMVDWDWAQQVMGSSMHPQNLYPERWLVRDFPTGQQCEQLLGG
jgi:hypothetical protein